MKRQMIKTLFMTAAMAMTMATVSFAGTWISQADQWKYQNDDGTLAKSQWITDNGKFYYIGDDEYMLSNDRTPDGYIVGADGAWDGSGRILLFERMDRDANDAYYEKLKKTKNVQCYTIIDYDRNGNPELILRTGTDKDGYYWTAYGWEDEEVVQLSQAPGENRILLMDRDKNVYLERILDDDYKIDAWLGNSTVTHTGRVSDFGSSKKVEESYNLYVLPVYGIDDSTPFEW